MDSYYVTQPNAKRLAEQGYKGEFPQMVWCRHYITNKPYLTFWTTSVMNKAYIPAPTHLAALEWLQAKLEDGYRIKLDVHDCEVVMMRKKTATWVVSPRPYDEAISAILDHLEGASHD